VPSITNKTNKPTTNENESGIRRLVVVRHCRAFVVGQISSPMAMNAMRPARLVGLERRSSTDRSIDRMQQYASDLLSLLEHSNNISCARLGFVTAAFEHMARRAVDERHHLAFYGYWHNASNSMFETSPRRDASKAAKRLTFFSPCRGTEAYTSQASAEWRLKCATIDR
jgi:hypothetical protein